MEKEKYKGFVDFNTARHAFEAGLFQTKMQLPRGWVRKQQFTANMARRETRGGIQKRLPVVWNEMRAAGSVNVGVYGTMRGLFPASLLLLFPPPSHHANKQPSNLVPQMPSQQT